MEKKTCNITKFQGKLQYRTKQRKKKEKTLSIHRHVLRRIITGPIVYAKQMFSKLCKTNVCAFVFNWTKCLQYLMKNLKI